MDELVDEINENIRAIEHSIERSKKFHEYPYMKETDHYYRLVLLCHSLDKWETILKMVLRYKRNRCSALEKKSKTFQSIIEIQLKSVPGFVTKQTYESMIEYMKQLEWKIDSLNGTWTSQAD